MRSKRRPGGRLVLVGLPLSFCCAALAFVLALYAAPRPDLYGKAGFSRVFLDRRDRVLRITLAPDGAYRIFTPLTAMPPELMEATLLYEDRSFYRHPGVNPLALLRSVAQMALGGRRMGGSTISMQVVRLTRKNNGELHKSTTMMFFDETGAYEAMLCFTVNLTALDQAKKMLDSLMNVMPFDSPEAMGSDLTIADYSKLVIADIIKTVGKPSALGSKEVKLRILRKLEEKGVFQLKDSVPQVCELLDISQATLYNYLREIRTQGSGFLPLSQK